jgi:hypothetical protein
VLPPGRLAAPGHFYLQSIKHQAQEKVAIMRASASVSNTASHFGKDGWRNDILGGFYAYGHSYFS